MGKKILSLVMAVALLISCFYGCAGSSAETETTCPEDEISDSIRDALNHSVILAVGGHRYYACGSMHTLNESSRAVTIHDLLYVPVGAVGRGFGGEFLPDDSAEAGILTVEDREIRIVGDSMTVNAETVVMAGPAFWVGEEMMAPAEDLCRGLEIDCVSENGMVLLGKNLAEARKTLQESEWNVLCTEIGTSLGSVYVNNHGGSRRGLKLREYLIDSTLIPYVTPVETVIFRVGDMYIEDMVVWKSKKYENGHTFGFTVYNYLGYCYGAVEVYDRNDNLLSVERIPPVDGKENSVVSGITDIFWLGWKIAESIDKQNLDYMLHKNGMEATETDIEVDVPAGGYVIVTGNAYESDYVAMWNLVHTIVEVFSLMKDLAELGISTKETSSFKKLLEDYMISQLASDPAMVMELATDFRLMIDNVGRAIPTWEKKAAAKRVWQEILEIFEDLDLDLRKMLATGVDMAGDMLDTKLEEIGQLADEILSDSLTTWTIINDATNLINLLVDNENSKYITGICLAVQDWREAYAFYLKEHQSNPTVQGFYEEGEGRYTLAYLTDDGIPELLVMNSYGQFWVLTYENMQVQQVVFSNGSSDVVRFPYEQARWTGDGRFLLKKENGWEVYRLSNHDHPYTEYILDCELLYENGQYYYNPFEADKLCPWIYEYRLDYVDRPVSAEAYWYRCELLGLNEDEMWQIETDDLLPITPEGILEGLGH